MIMISSPSGRVLMLLLLIAAWDKNPCLSASAFDYQAGVSCSSDTDCENSYGKGSFCLSSGVCSNPYHSGCLRTLFPDDDQYTIRHCNSHDEEIDNPTCRRSEHRYPEINIYNQDWEVALFFSWIYQIVLSEVLNVPVRVGLGRTSANLTSKESLQTSNFYSLGTTLPAMDGPSYPWHAIRKANEMGGDCSRTEDDCVHIFPDVWMGQRSRYEEEYADGQIDYLDGNGQVGKVSWYVPKRTAQRYPFTITYLGLKENREKLAEIFHRPVSWRDYCHQVSATNCSQPDEVASRYPETEELGHKYFFSDGYIGHFRPTDKNDCGIVDPNATSVTATESNLTCTGHIVNAKCSWSTFLEAQAYWNDIALESNGPDWINGGYAYDDIVDIWQAANATQSDVISFFFEPAFASQQFRNTDYEYTKVVLPATTIQCRNSRVPPSDRCSVDTTVRRGLLEGSCDDNAHATKQVVAISLRDNTVATSDAYRSPAYAFVRNFNIDELELGEMLFEFARRGQTGHAAREVVCEWVGNNMEYVSSFIPPSHPRAVIPKTNKRQVVEVVAYSVGAFAVLYVVAATVEMYEKRTMKVFLYAQVKFIFVVLFGLLLVAIASILYVVEPSVVVCTTEFWLVAIGYTCMLVPLIIKVSAMNQLMRASARMRRIRIRTNALYAKVMAWLIVVTIFLVVWTAVDAPRPIQLRTLSEDRTTIFTETGCMSSSEYWVVIYLSWEMLLAISAFVLAFQSRKAKAEFNESKSLCMMIYSHLGFACLRIIAFYVLDEDDMHLQAVGTSLFLSLDVIMAVTIYLIPKFYLCHELEKPRQSELQGSATVREIQARAQSSTIQSLRESSVRIILGNQTTLTENTIEGLEPPVENADKRAGTIVTGAGNQNESEKQEQDDAMEKAKAPIIEDDSNDISSSTNLRHRVAAQGNSSVTNSSPSHQSGENRRLSAFPQLASARSFRLGRGISSRAASFRHTTVAENFSKYGRKSVDLLFGPSADLEMIQSFREMAGDSDESEYDLGMISEDVDNNEVGERGNNTSGDDSLVDSGDDSRPKIWTRNSQFSKSDESLTASKNVKVMDA